MAFNYDVYKKNIENNNENSLNIPRKTKKQDH